MRCYVVKQFKYLHAYEHCLPTCNALKIMCENVCRARKNTFFGISKNFFVVPTYPAKMIKPWSFSGSGCSYKRIYAVLVAAISCSTKKKNERD